MKYSLHPYKGYLNTKYRLYCNCETVQELVIRRCSDSVVVKEMLVQPNMVESIVFDEPGEYSVEEKGRELHIAQINVLDGYKFGGSSFKNAFLFENTPWIFVVMRDRTYFHNRDTGKEYVEAISPDEIEYVSSSLVIMSNAKQDVKTLFSLDEEKPVLAFSHLVHIDNNVIIWKTVVDEDKSELCVAKMDDLDNIKHFTCSDDYVVLAERHALYFYNQGKVLSVSFDDISTNNELKYDGDFLTFLDAGYIVSTFSEGKLKIKSLKDDADYQVNYEGTLVSVNGKQIVDIRETEQKLNKFCQNEIPSISVETQFTSLEIFASSNMFTYKEIVESYTFKNGKMHTLDKVALLKDDQGEVLATLNANRTWVYTHNQLVCLLSRNNIYVVGSKYGRFLKHTNIEKMYNTPMCLVCAIRNYNKTELYSINGNGYLNNLGCDIEEYECDRLEDYGVLEYKKTHDLYPLGISCLAQSIGHFKMEDPRRKTILTYSDNIICQGGKICSLPFISSSEKGCYGLVIKDCNYILYSNKIDLGWSKKAENYTKRIILKNICDNTSYSNAFLSEDGKHILSMEKEKCQIINVVSGEAEVFENLSFLRHINGIRPYFKENQYRQVKFVNPISGTEIDTEAIAQYNFVSPDGNLYADSRLEEYTEYYDLIEKRLLTKDEYKKLIEYYCYTLGKDKDVIAYRRKAFSLNHLDFLKNQLKSKGWPDRSDKKWMEALASHKDVDFLRLFIEFHGVAIIRKTSDNTITNKIKLGDPLWFLNYVAFSHDSRYVAIAGRYPNHSGHGGLLLVYDLENDSEIYKQTNGYAVWLSAFTKDGHFAAYSSEPVSYLGVVPKGDNQIETVEKYNFLTFSSDGQYIALSKQGYVAWNNGRNPLWGHQPSCLVSLRKTNNIGKEIAKYQDLSDEGIDGTFTAKSVSSVSFSKDNSKLMMVGRDGVVIIRNTHFDDDSTGC